MFNPPFIETAREILDEVISEVRPNTDGYSQYEDADTQEKAEEAAQALDKAKGLAMIAELEGLKTEMEAFYPIAFETLFGDIVRDRIATLKAKWGVKE